MRSLNFMFNRNSGMNKVEKGIIFRRDGVPSASLIYLRYRAQNERFADVEFLVNDTIVDYTVEVNDELRKAITDIMNLDRNEPVTIICDIDDSEKRYSLDAVDVDSTDIAYSTYVKVAKVETVDRQMADVFKEMIENLDNERRNKAFIQLVKTATLIELFNGKYGIETREIPLTQIRNTVIKSAEELTKFIENNIDAATSDFEVDSANELLDKINYVTSIDRTSILNITSGDSSIAYLLDDKIRFKSRKEVKEARYEIADRIQKLGINWSNWIVAKEIYYTAIKLLLSTKATLTMLNDLAVSKNEGMGDDTLYSLLGILNSIYNRGFTGVYNVLNVIETPDYILDSKKIVGMYDLIRDNRRMSIDFATVLSLIYDTEIRLSKAEYDEVDRILAMVDLKSLVEEDIREIVYTEDEVIIKLGSLQTVAAALASYRCSISGLLSAIYFVRNIVRK